MVNTLLARHFGGVGNQHEVGIHGTFSKVNPYKKNVPWQSGRFIPCGHAHEGFDSAVCHGSEGLSRMI